MSQEDRPGLELEKSLALDQSKMEGLKNELDSMEEFENELENDMDNWSRSEDQQSDDSNLSEEGLSNKNKTSEQNSENNSDKAFLLDLRSKESESMEGYTSTNSRNVIIHPHSDSKDISNRNLNFDENLKKNTSERFLNTSSVAQQPKNSEIIVTESGRNRRLNKSEKQRRTFDLSNSSKEVVILEHLKSQTDPRLVVKSDPKLDKNGFEEAFGKKQEPNQHFKKKGPHLEKLKMQSNQYLKADDFDIKDNRFNKSGGDNYYMDQDSETNMGDFSKARNRLNSDEFEEVEGNGVVFINNNDPSEKVILNPDMVSPLNNLDINFGFDGQFGGGMTLNLEDSLTAYENRDTPSQRNIQKSSKAFRS